MPGVEGDQGGDRDRAPGRGLPRDQQPGQARGTDREQKPPGEQPQEGQDLTAVVGRVAGDPGCHRELWPAVRRLPAEVRRPEQERDADGRPRPWRAHHVQAPGEDKSDGQPRAEEEQGVLVLQADPGHHAHDQPEAPVAARQLLDDQPKDDRPGEQVGVGGGVEMPSAEVAGQGGRDCRQDLGPSRPAEVAPSRRRERR